LVSFPRPKSAPLRFCGNRRDEQDPNGLAQSRRHVEVASGGRQRTVLHQPLKLEQIHRRRVDGREMLRAMTISA
jgi:hypothetical protein